MIKIVMLGFRIPEETRKKVFAILASKGMSLQEAGIRWLERLIKENKKGRFL